MRGVDVIRQLLQATEYLTTAYLSELSDADLLVRPVDGANHIAWQMGHLITAERALVCEQLPGTAYPDLPAGFDQKHGMGADVQGKQSDFCTTAQYIDLFSKTRKATLAAVEKLQDADLDRPTVGDMAKFAPNLAVLLILVSNHSLMHGGQFSVVRRKLGKKVLF